jgi:hypothetical protein
VADIDDRGAGRGDAADDLRELLDAREVVPTMASGEMPRS